MAYKVKEQEKSGIKDGNYNGFWADFDSGGSKSATNPSLRADKETEKGCIGVEIVMRTAYYVRSLEICREHCLRMNVLSVPTVRLLSFLKRHHYGVNWQTACCLSGQIAQSVEHRTENPGVAGSIPALSTLVTNV